MIDISLQVITSFQLAMEGGLPYIIHLSIHDVLFCLNIYDNIEINFEKKEKCSFAIIRGIFRLSQAI